MSETPKPITIAEHFTQRVKMGELEIILVLMTFVLPAIFILADNRMWVRKKN